MDIVIVMQVQVDAHLVIREMVPCGAMCSLISEGCVISKTWKTVELLMLAGF